MMSVETSLLSTLKSSWTTWSLMSLTYTASPGNCPVILNIFYSSNLCMRKPSKPVCRAQIGSWPTPSPSFPSNLLQCNNAPIVEFNESLGTPFDISRLDACLYTCLRIWLTNEQITNAQHLLHDVHPAQLQHLDASLRDHGFDHSPDTISITVLPLLPTIWTPSTCWKWTSGKKGCQMLARPVSLLGGSAIKCLLLSTSLPIPRSIRSSTSYESTSPPGRIRYCGHHANSFC